MRREKSSFLIGTSGYNYHHWADGIFYPQDLPQNKWLEYYTQFFLTVELNVTFYRLLPKKIFEGWYKKTPKSFTFSIKGNRFITHLKKLNDCSKTLQLFFENTTGLKEKRKIILWQFPPQFSLEISKLKTFVSLLNNLPECRYSFEFRNKTWFVDEVVEVLNQENFSICLLDYFNFDIKVPPKSSFIYIRKHGVETLYSSCYTNEELCKEACKIKNYLKEKKDVYIYFNNDAQGYAISNALTLKEMLQPEAK